MPKSNNLINLLKLHKRLVIIAVIVAVLFFALIFFIQFQLHSITSHYITKKIIINSQLSARFISSGITFDNNTNLQNIKSKRNYTIESYPYSIISYKSYNLSNLTINESIFKNAIPSKIYIWNTSGENFQGLNTNQVLVLLKKYLKIYNITDNISIISYANISQIQNNSILLVLTGLMPIQMFQQVNNSNFTTISFLLNKGTSIIYTGANLSRVVQSPFSTPLPSQNIPSFLEWIPNTTIYNSSFYFSKKTFKFFNGTDYGPITYINYLNGSVVAFSNYPDSWNSVNQFSYDLAKSIAELFWMPKYATGYRSVNLSNFSYSSGTLGLVLNSSNVNYTYENHSLIVNNFNSGFPRITISNSNNFSFNINFLNSTKYYYFYKNNISYNATINLSNYSKFFYIQNKPNFSLNGSVIVPNLAIPSIPILANISEFVTCQNLNLTIEPSIYFYTINFTQIGSPIFLGFHYPCKKSFNNKFTFYYYPTFNLPSGTYFAVVRNSNFSVVGSGMFNIPKININLSSENFKTNQFILTITANNKILSGIPFKLNLNNFGNESGTIVNGSIIYQLPQGIVLTYSQNLNFTLYMLNHKYIKFVPGQVTPFVVNQKIIILGIAGIFSILMMVLVKAPNKDEFYIDVPSIPIQKKIPVELDTNEFISIFNKLNLYYHWRFMPLSKDEIKTGVFNNIRFNGMPVTITYDNLEKLLIMLSHNNILTDIDNLYLPNSWIDQVQHDAEYLATFKKLRLYFVSHTFMFTDLDLSNSGDITATFHDQKINIIIYSKSTKFKNIPIYENSKTYLAFLNNDKLEEFKLKLYNSNLDEARELELYISLNKILLINADSPEIII
ncbi:MAG: hypothetical protein M1168_01165 [Candidatus Marsarchaeota archaeon]|nr:hypothetical protein [Candidatus Marsarchaeota archaeon]MCL5094576.1 hypothetical protein [Candidatus Marsarchaeota archaeon]